MRFFSRSAILLSGPFAPLLAAAILAAAPGCLAATTTFAGSQIVWQVDGSGRTESLRLAGQNREWVYGRGHAFTSVTVGGRTFEATRFAPRAEGPGLFDIDFGASGTGATYRIAADGAFVTVELVEVRGAQPDSICLVQLPVAIDEHVGQIVNARWNDDAVFCVMGLSREIEIHPVAKDRMLTAQLHAEFGFAGRKVALIGTTPAGFYPIVERLEGEFGLPSPHIDGQWEKTSAAARTSYLFTDLTAANVKETINWAKLGGFRYILIYVHTWAQTRGSYAINLDNFPGGEAQLKQVVDECHAANLRVGIHILANFVAKNDPLVRPKPDHRLLKDATCSLAADIGAADTTFQGAGAMDAFKAPPNRRDSSGGRTVQIDDELITYREVDARDGTTFQECVRGADGTTRAPHLKGAPISHLAELYSSFLVDLRTDLGTQLAERLAGVINRCGLDMIYVDGGAGGKAMSPAWYYLGMLEQEIFQRVRRDFLFEANAITPWIWHWNARAVCDDYSALDPDAYLDVHKMERFHLHEDNFLPSDLGWWGFLADRTDHPATTPWEVEHYGVRLIAYDSPVGFETTTEALHQNLASEALMRRFAEFERLRLAHAVPAELRRKLQTGEWTLVEENGERAFVPVRRTEARLQADETLRITNAGSAQPLRFRLVAQPVLKPLGDPENVVLFHPDRPLLAAWPAAGTYLPGALIERVSYTENSTEPDVYLVGATEGRGALKRGIGRDLTGHRALGVRLRVTGRPPAGEPPAVLNVQLESATNTMREHYIDLDFEGERVVTLAESDFGRLMREFHAVDRYYLPKTAGYTFNYAGVVALNFRWMRAPSARQQRVEILDVEALQESASPLRRPCLLVNGGPPVVIPADLAPGDAAECAGGPEVRIYDRNGGAKATLPLAAAPPSLPAGESAIELRATGPAAATLTIEARGDPIRF